MTTAPAAAPAAAANVTPTGGGGANTSTPKRRLEFHYDHLGRRIAKRTSAWQPPGGTSPDYSDSADRDDPANWTEISHQIFIYDGWNLIARYAASDTTNPEQTYLWGTDMSGSMQGAGGIGCLLAVTGAGSGTASERFIAYDGNGNITATVDAMTTATLSARDYDAFGRTVLDAGDHGISYGFSTKYEDAESGLLYYGYRYYQARTGRWLSPDPIEERGGVNLYGFVRNDGLNRSDYLGLDEQVRASFSHAMGLVLAQIYDSKVSKAIGLHDSALKVVSAWANEDRRISYRVDEDVIRGDAWFGITGLGTRVLALGEERIISPGTALHEGAHLYNYVRRGEIGFAMGGRRDEGMGYMHQYLWEAVVEDLIPLEDMLKVNARNDKQMISRARKFWQSFWFDMYKPGTPTQALIYSDTTAAHADKKDWMNLEKWLGVRPSCSTIARELNKHSGALKCLRFSCEKDGVERARFFSWDWTVIYTNREIDSYFK